jgi:hypothetical protein
METHNLAALLAIWTVVSIGMTCAAFKFLAMVPGSNVLMRDVPKRNYPRWVLRLVWTCQALSKNAEE